MKAYEINLRQSKIEEVNWCPSLYTASTS